LSLGLAYSFRSGSLSGALLRTARSGARALRFALTSAGGLASISSGVASMADGARKRAATLVVAGVSRETECGH
jgi:hypothetical protein